MESEQPKPEQVKWNEAEWGKMEYREFNECPVCHCPNRYTQEALRDEMPKKPPAPGSMKLIYQGPLFTTEVDVVLDSCCRCGAVYTVARSKKKKFMVGVMKNPRGN